MANTEKMVEKKLRMAVLKSAELLVENGLSDWTIKLSSRRAVLATTAHKEKIITFSKHFLIVSEKEELIGVTLHEATHALLGPGHGHGETFIKKCKEISPNDKYATRGVNVPLRRFLLTCPRCGQKGSNNLSLTRYCGHCFNKDNSKIAFDIKPNELKVKVW